MTVTKKKESIEDVISRGGEVKSSQKSKREKRAVCMLFPVQMLEDITACVERRPGMNRTAWVLEAIQQKLNAEYKL